MIATIDNSNTKAIIYNNYNNHNGKVLTIFSRESEISAEYPKLKICIFKKRSLFAIDSEDEPKVVISVILTLIFIKLMLKFEVNEQY